LLFDRRTPPEPAEIQLNGSIGEESGCGALHTVMHAVRRLEVGWNQILDIARPLKRGRAKSTQSRMDCASSPNIHPLGSYVCRRGPEYPSNLIPSESSSSTSRPTHIDMVNCSCSSISGANQVPPPALTSFLSSFVCLSTMLLEKRVENSCRVGSLNARSPVIQSDEEVDV
jgi:hypothetical protein